MNYLSLKRIEDLARIAGHLDEDPIVPPPARWGPASWWRIGLVVMALLIAAVAIWPALT